MMSPEMSEALAPIHRDPSTPAKSTKGMRETTHLTFYHPRTGRRPRSSGPTSIDLGFGDYRAPQASRGVFYSFLAGSGSGGETVQMRLPPVRVALATVISALIAMSLAFLPASPALADDPPSIEPAAGANEDAAKTPPAEQDADTTEATPAESAPVPTRVYLWVDRYEELGGFIVEEDHDLLTIRAVDGKIRSFPKNRLFRIIRLNDIDTPRPGMVELRDGTLLSGELVKDEFDEVEIRIEGITTRLPRASVVQTRLDLTLEEKYQRFQEMIEPDEYTRRFELASWLFEEKAYQLARAELIEIVAKSKLPRAVGLLKLVEAQLLLEADSGASTSPSPLDGRTRPDDRSTGPVDLRDLLPKEIISADDVNIIRVYEIDFRKPPRLHISPDTIREILEQYGASPLIPADSGGRTALFRADSAEIVDLMFRLKARDLYSRIEVKSEPPALNLFRQRVHDAWLIPNCATSRCHGGLDGGRFFLHRRNAKSEQVRYTNLLILERWNELEMPLVDYLDPGRSLLIQYGLPKNEARFPHPDVKGWSPVFSKGNPRLLRDAFGWMNSMYRPRSRYPVDYEAPIISTPDLPEPQSSDSPDDRRGR